MIYHGHKAPDTIVLLTSVSFSDATGAVSSVGSAIVRVYWVTTKWKSLWVSFGRFGLFTTIHSAENEKKDKKLTQDSISPKPPIRTCQSGFSFFPPMPRRIPNSVNYEWRFSPLARSTLSICNSREWGHNQRAPSQQIKFATRNYIIVPYLATLWKTFQSNFGHFSVKNGCRSHN